MGYQARCFWRPLCEIFHGRHGVCSLQVSRARINKTHPHFFVQHGHEKNLLKCSWSPDGQKVISGSSDRSAYVWDTTTSELLYQLPGHLGAVNEVSGALRTPHPRLTLLVRQVCYHPTEPIVGSCSSDKTMFLGEIAA